MLKSKRVREAKKRAMIIAYQRPRVVLLELHSQLTKSKFLSSMETLEIPQKKHYFHYNHTDPCNFARWTSRSKVKAGAMFGLDGVTLKFELIATRNRESYEFMYNRPWKQVVDFYSDVVNCQATLLDLFGAEPHHIFDDADVEPSENSEVVTTPSQKRGGRWGRMNYKIVLSYHGSSFDGWQRQPDLNTVQGLVEKCLGKFVDEKKASLLRDKGLPLEGAAVVAGRTDKGVTGLQQVCSFYTWRTDVKPQDIEDAINSTAPGKLRVISVSQVSRTFHPNFSAKWRHYLYIFPLNDGETDVENICHIEKYDDRMNDIFIDEGSLKSSVEDDQESKKKPTRFQVCKVNKLLQQLEGKLLSYKMFARDTKPSRNTGPPTECFVFHARATKISLTHDAENGQHKEAMCIELVANRFLRKMVRVLVATSIREAAAGAEDDALIKLMDATCRRATAPPAPPHGLCLVNVGYQDFDSQKCLIF